MSDSTIEALSAAVGGCVSTVVLLPLDCIKTRLQANSQGNDDGSLGTARRLVSEGGVQALFTGVFPAAVQSSLEKAIYFFSYTLMKERFRDSFGSIGTAGNLTLGKHR
jgi:hypothetical protein